MGMMPANGLQYAPPHPCVCYIDEKINGFNALAPKRQRSEIGSQKSEKLEKGPAYGIADGKTASDKDWPIFQHDNMRSGTTKAKISDRLELLWNVKHSPTSTK